MDHVTEIATPRHGTGRGVRTEKGRQERREKKEEGKEGGEREEKTEQGCVEDGGEEGRGAEREVGGRLRQIRVCNAKEANKMTELN